MKRLLFFLRGYNGIDNISPSIYFYLKSELDSVADIIFYQPTYDNRNNENLEFLKREFQERLTIYDVNDFLGIKSARYYQENSLGDLYRTWQRIRLGFPYTVEFLNQKASDPFIEEILEKTPKARLAIFDQVKNDLIAHTVNHLKKSGISVVSLPQSPFTTVTPMKTTEDLSRDPKKWNRLQNLELFDCVSFCDSFYLDAVKKAYAEKDIELPYEGKTEIIGSSRYCKKWIDVREGFVGGNAQDLPKHNKRNVAILLTNPINNIFLEEANRLIRFFGNYPEVSFVIKPHTRKPYTHGVIDFFKQLVGKKAVTDTYDLKNLPDNVVVDYETSTSTIINWSDALIYYSTSVALEGFQTNKIMINLSYAHGNRTVYDILEAGFMAKSRNDLRIVLEKIIQEKPPLNPGDFYEPSGIERLKKEVIQGNHKNSVYKQHVEFLNKWSR